MRHQIEIERTAEIAHRLPNHPGKCRLIHGHSIRVRAAFITDKLDQNGMVIDFHDLSTQVLDPVISELDHAFLVAPNDPLREIIPAEFVRFVAIPPAPSCEAIAQWITHQVSGKLGIITSTVQLDRIIVHETDDSRAICFPRWRHS